MLQNLVRLWRIPTSLSFRSLGRPLIGVVMKTLLCANRINLSFALFLLIAISVQSQTASKNRGIADLQWFSGHWSCDGKFIGSGKPISADLSFESILQDKWLMFRHDDRPPFSYHALSEWGWDDKRQQYLSTAQDSSGGIRVFYSSGFRDSKLVWDGRALGNPAAPAERFEYEKISPSVFTASYSFQKDGHWQAVDKSTCTRNPE
jgi:hypothetical protein